MESTINAAPQIFIDREKMLRSHRRYWVLRRAQDIVFSLLALILLAPLALLISLAIVGPRPALPREVDLYNDYQRQRLYVTPGLSCYWQIAPHRNEMSFDEWVSLDLKYIQERSFWVDWKIIFLTVRAMFMRYGE